MIGQLIEDRYKVIEKLGEGGMSLVYRAEDKETGQMVVLKFLKEGITSRRVEDVLRFQREAGAIAKLEHPGIMKVYGTGEYKQTPYIVMELLQGKSLADLFKEKRRFNVEESVEIVLQISEVLNYVHGKGIIHRDLKPGNIMLLWQPAAQQPPSTNYQVKVLDFGLAQILELKEIKVEKEIVGTFGYMSPEQTGIVHKPVDERSDLYSLGIIFYQLITGQLPFKGKDVGTILHQQVAKMPPPISQLNPEIPRVIEEMVMKLLQKDMDKRYQTASGLIVDLKRFQQGETTFTIATRDKLRRLIYRTRFIGREEELTHLKELFNQAQAGQGKLCFIAGEAGRGKSRLVDELRSYVYERGGVFIEGKCFRKDNKLPYQPFTEALNEYIKKVEYSSPQQKDKTIIKMKEVLGDLGGVIEKISPFIKDLIGQSPPLIELEPERENRRFLTVSSSFFRNISTKEEPLVLYIDDLQWSDGGSLTLLEEITSEIKDSHLLVLGNYRDNEVDPQHKLIRLIQEARERRYPLEEIKLSFFDQARTNRMVSELLAQEEETLKEISTYIQEKSQGNPFFILEITRQLVEEEVLYYKENVWEIDHQKLQAITIPTNILDIVLHRIDALSEEETEILSYGAVIGREFGIELLFRLIDKPRAVIINVVDEAVQMQLLEWKVEERGRLLFVHERIKGAFYRRMGKEKARGIHLKIAQIIEKINRENIEAVIFDLAHHYSEAGQEDKTLEYAPTAAQKAKESYANDEAIKYYKLGIELLEKKGEKNSNKWIRTKEELAEVYRTTGKHDEAIETSQQILPLKKKLKDKVRIYRSIGDAWFRKGNWEQCENNLAEGLRLLREKFLRRKTEVMLSLLRELFVHILHCIFPKVFMHREGKDVKPEDKDILWIYFSLSWMYVLSNIEKFLYSTLKVLNIAESRVGRSRELGISLGAYGSLCMAIPLFKRAIKYHQKAIEMTRGLKDELGSGHATQLMGFCYSWKGDYQKSIEIFEQSRNLFQKVGDMWDLAMVLDGLGYDYRYLSDYDKSIDSFSQYLEISQKTNNDHGISAAQTNLSYCYIEKGNFEKAEELGIKALVFSEEKKIWYPHCYSNVNFGYLKIERGNYKEAIKYLGKAKKLNEENTFLKNYVICLYPYLADAYIEQFKAQYTTFDVKEKKQKIKRIRIACRDALKRTKRWPNHYDISLRVMAKYYALIKKKEEAEKYFLKSINHAETLGKRFELAKGYYEYGNFFKTQNRGEEAKNNWQEAYNLFTEIGAQAYIKRTADLLGIILEEAREGVEEPETAQKRLRLEQELKSLIKVSQYLSSILNLDDLLERIMDRAIEVVGAERGFLMLYQGIAEGKRIDETAKGNLVVTVARNADKESLDSEAFQASRTVIARVEETHQPLIITDASSDEELRTQPSVVKYKLRSILCVPFITKKEEILGIIYLDNRLISGLFSQKHLDLLNTLATQAGISIENAILLENEKEMARKVSEAEARARYTDILEKQKRELEIAYQEKDQAYEELKATQAQLIQSEKMATIGRLAGGVAHEINTPLGTILTNTEMLMVEEPATGYQRESLALIKESSLRCKTIVEQLLKYSRLPGAELEMVDIGQVIDECYLLLERQLADEGIKINREYGPIPKIKGNANELRQVFTNIILNARDAIKKTFDDKKRQGEIKIRAYQEGRSLVVEVQDDGCGIPPQDVGKIFDPFFTTKDIGRGTGLGLSISQRIIERHKGKIEAQSKIGKGTTMRVELPIKKRGE